MKQYKTFPHSREAVQALWVDVGATPEDVAPVLAAFDEEDRLAEIDHQRQREERSALELASETLLRAMGPPPR